MGCWHHVIDLMGGSTISLIHINFMMIKGIQGNEEMAIRFRDGSARRKAIETVLSVSQAMP